MPIPAACSDSWVSLLNYLSYRRLAFLTFFKSNRETAVFTVHYMDAFWAELVSPIYRTRVSDAKWALAGVDLGLHFFTLYPLLTMSIPIQEANMALLGMQAAITKPGALKYKEDTRELVQRLDVYCDSDETLWGAFTSGYFLERDFHMESTPYDIRPWWNASEPLPNVASVLEDWEAACRESVKRALSCEEGERAVGVSYKMLYRHSQDIAEAMELSKRVLAGISTSRKKLENMRLELSQIMFGTASIL